MKNLKSAFVGKVALVKLIRAGRLPLSQFRSLSQIPDVQLISLQKGEGTKQLNEIDFEVVNFGSEFDNGESRFVDTAAVIENCDLIITSDTSVAHLAGALGARTWVMLQFTPDGVGQLAAQIAYGTHL